MMSSLARDLAMALDPALLLRSEGLAPDPWQALVLRTASARVLMCWCRQSGKTTTAAAAGLHAALHRPGALVLIVSPGERQSRLLFRRMLALYQALGRPVPAEAELKLSLSLANGAEIVALPGAEATIRGFASVDTLLVDEAARVADDVFAAVLPMLGISAGRLIALSTPYGKRGWFHEAWVNGGPDWHRSFVPAELVPRLTPAVLAEARRVLGLRRYSEEFDCVFEADEDAVFTSDDIAAAASSEIRPLAGASRFFTAFDSSDQELAHVVFGPRSRADV